MQFYIVDVFAESKYAGNQLAVFMAEGQNLSSEEMQQIAKEINFAESTFVLSNQKKDGGYDVRIFTRDVEVPFAGHPTLGTAFILHQMLEQGRGNRIVLNLKAGQIPVDINEHGLTMIQNPPKFGEIFPAQQIADILQIDVSDIDTDYPVQVVSTGLSAAIVPLKTLAAVQKCVIHHENFKALHRTIKTNLLIFCKQTIEPNNDLHARVFIDGEGFEEDPATGSANGNLAAYLLEHNVLNQSQIKLRVEQGYAVGRPSLIQIDASLHDGQFNLRIGGKVFFIAEGKWQR